MKALKFVILAAGLLGVVSILLPYASVDRGTDSVSFSALDALRDVELAVSGMSEAKEIAEASPGLDEAKLRSSVNRLEDVLDGLKIAVAVIFAPFVLLLVVGVTGAVRGKLGRVGGTFALLLGLAGMVITGFFLAVWGSAEIKSSGGTAGIAQYVLFVAAVTGFIGGLLTLIRPDRGGRFD